MIPVRAKKILGISFGVALIAAFLPPLLSGSNHSCPVLREKDMEKGPSARAVPAFARRYNVDCTYCHTAWPQLNRQGYIFRRLGYRMPWEVPKSSDASPTGNKAPNTIPSTGSQSTPSSSANPLPSSTTAALKQAIDASKQPASPEKIAEGKAGFTQMQCFTCHINGDNIIDRSKPLRGANFQKKYPEDAQIAALVRRGVPGTAMPGYAKERLSDEQLSAIIAYIRSLTPQQ